MNGRNGLALMFCAAIAVLGLVGCGGGGELSGPGMLFVTTADGVAIFHAASGLTGEVVPNRYLAGANTGFGSLNLCSNHVALPANDLYLGDSIADAVFIFRPASTVDGNVAPTRLLQGDAVPLDDPVGLVVDTTRDILYVGDSSKNTIYVWDDASTLDGNVAPDRTITGMTTCRDLALDRHANTLYACLGDEIWVFGNASTRDGAAAADRVIAGAATQLAGAFGIELDRNRDLLYVANRGSDNILVFDNASTINGNVQPLHVIAGATTDLSAPIDLALDVERDHLYEVNDVSPARPKGIRVWHNASSVDGNIPPNRTITSPGGLLDDARALTFISG